MRIFITFLLVFSLQSANAQDSGNSLQQIELNAWNYYCQNTLDGVDNAKFCDCVITKQYEVNDQKIVKSSLLQLVKINENATNADNQTAQKALNEMYGGDDQDASDDMQSFDDTLDGNINICTAKP